MATLGQILSETGYGMPRAQDLARRNMEEQEAQYRLDQSARINEQNQLALANLRRQEDARRRMAQGPTTLPGASATKMFEALPTGFTGHPDLAIGTEQPIAPAPLPAAGAPAAAASVTPQLTLEELRRSELRGGGGAGLAMPAQYIAAQPTSALTIQQFQALPPAEQARRLQTENDRRALARLDANVAKPPAALFDIASLPVTAGASLIEKGANAIDFARFGRAIGLYDPDVTSVTVPGSGSFTPFYDRLRKAEAANQPLTAEQFEEQLRARPTTAPAAAPIASEPTKRAQSYDNKVTPYDAIIQTSAERYNIDPVVFKRLIGTESSFSPTAVSPRGEKFGLGIAQIAASHKLTREQMLDPNTAIPFAASLFAQYLNQNNGDYEKALLQYKGATSAKGKADMASAVNTVLSGSAVAAPGAAAAPTAAAGPAAQLLAPTAGVTTEKAPTKATEFYTANTNAITADRRILDYDYERMRGLIQTTIKNQQQVDKQAYDSTRTPLEQQFKAFMEAGIPSEAQRIRTEVAKLDYDFSTRMNTTNTDTQAKMLDLDTRYRTGRLMVDGMDAVTRLEYGNDPRALEQVLSFHTGQPVTFQPVADGTYIMALNGKPRGTYTRAEIGSMAKEYFDAEYRKAKAASQVKLAELTAKSSAEQTLEIVKAQVGMIREAALEMIKNGAEMRKLEVKGRMIKITPTGDGNVIVSSEDGTNLGVLDLRPGQPQDLNGVSIPSIPRVVSVLR